ncbi:MAG: hypothetical protein H6559_36720 [Lewinellaceae bacterium]|nr:hypothetical protein [Lewinellaceae bacterium]
MEKYNQLRNLIRNGSDDSMIEALHGLQGLFVEKGLDPGPVDLLESRFRRNSRLNLEGVISFQDYGIENNCITKSTLGFVNQLAKGDDFTGLKPLKIDVLTKIQEGKKIEVKLRVFEEEHIIKLKVNWFYFLAFHGKDKSLIYKKLNVFNYHREAHAFNIPVKNNGVLKTEFATSYDVWSGVFRSPELKIENIQLFPNE